jgi:hypothetical protein
MIRDANANERRALVAAGFFPWGFGSWIHRDDEGTVVDTDQALAESAGYRRWAHNSTCDRVVHRMPVDTDEWLARRNLLAGCRRGA